MICNSVSITSGTDVFIGRDHKSRDGGYDGGQKNILVPW